MKTKTRTDIKSGYYNVTVILVIDVIARMH